MIMIVNRNDKIALFGEKCKQVSNFSFRCFRSLKYIKKQQITTIAIFTVFV